MANVLLSGFIIVLIAYEATLVYNLLARVGVGNQFFLLFQNFDYFKNVFRYQIVSGQDQGTFTQGQRNCH